MGLRMATPWRHPESGIYWYRRKVPTDLRQIIGKVELRRTLNTRDPATARVEFTRIASEIEAQWATLRQGVQPITHRQAVAIAGEVYREIVAAYGDNPDDPSGWASGLVSDQAMFAPKKVRMSFAGDETLMRRALEHARSTFYMSRVDEFLERRGLLVADIDKKVIHKAVGEAVVQAREQLHRMAGGDYRPDPNADRFPELTVQPKTALAEPSSADKTSDRYSLMAIYEAYATEGELAPSTRKAWRRMIAKVADVHPDIRTIDRAWCVDWKDSLMASGLSAPTVNDGYLSALRSVCGWAVTNGRIETNPLQGVAVKRRKKPTLRGKGYTDEEAKLILKAALQPVAERVSPEHAAARRWLPWLCAYTGARVGEIGQLRKSDIVARNRVHLVHITPEAGSTKNEQARNVALHPHLIEQGFLDFVRSRPSGPLFFDPGRRRGGSDENPQSKKAGERIAAWVRSLGITDPVVRPNHAWRHRFKTLSRRHALQTEAVTYMQGHAYKTEGDKYGEFEPEVLLAEISKLPAYSLT